MTFWVEGQPQILHLDILYQFCNEVIKTRNPGAELKWLLRLGTSTNWMFKFDNIYNIEVNGAFSNTYNCAQLANTKLEWDKGLDLTSNAHLLINSIDR